MGEHVCNVSLQLRRRLAWLWFFAAARSDERDSSLFRGVACPLNKPETGGVEYRRNHSQEPHLEYSLQTGRKRSRARGHHCAPARDRRV